MSNISPLDLHGFEQTAEDANANIFAAVEALAKFKNTYRSVLDGTTEREKALEIEGGLRDKWAEAEARVAASITAPGASSRPGTLRITRAAEGIPTNEDQRKLVIQRALHDSADYQEVVREAGDKQVELASMEETVAAARRKYQSILYAWRTAQILAVSAIGERNIIEDIVGGS